MNPVIAGSYAGSHLVLANEAKNPYTGGDMSTVVPAPATGSWYTRQWGCIRTDPTVIARSHTFPDGAIPDGQPLDPVAPVKVCLQYRTSWAQEEIDATAMVEAARRHPQFAFRPGGPATVEQVDVESQLRRLDQPLTNCQAVLAGDAPLYRNTVAPPPAVHVPAGPQNAANPIAAIVRADPGAEACRQAADAVATSMSGRFFHNPTRQDTMRFQKPFAPPGTGTGSARGPGSPIVGQPYYTSLA
jgi:hypothetical protein